MYELLPEMWVSDNQDAAPSRRKVPRRAPVTDILVWTECFALMVAVLAERFPSKAPQLWAYLRRIMHAARNYHGLAWVAYDRLYRRQALSQHSLDWAQEDSALYNEAFVGHAKAILRCRHCLSEFHTTETCPDLPPTLPHWPPQYSTGPAHSFFPPPPCQEVCRKYNENRCFVRRCRYRHVCLSCGHPHPAAFCGSHGGSGGHPHAMQDRSPPRHYNRPQQGHR